jgi:hypothetical protein
MTRTVISCVIDTMRDGDNGASQSEATADAFARPGA